MNNKNSLSFFDLKKAQNKHFLRVMKIISVCMLALTFCLNAIALKSQNNLITISQNNVQMEKVLNEIEKQSNYLFVYEKNIDIKQIISVDAVQVQLKDILNQLFRGKNIAYTIEGSNIILRLNPKGIVQDNKKTISGIVKDTNGDPVIGASVAIKGTTLGAMTDVDGKFTFTVPGDSKTLVFSYVGMKTLEVQIGTKTSFDVTMEDSAQQMSEVVVTALGIKKEAKSLSYHVQQINADEVTKVPDANFINSLSGKVAGVTINSASSGVGSASRVVMRGTKSLFGSNNALYVIDGVPMFNVESGDIGDRFSGAGQSGDALANINPDDIESLSVLSGASAAALYGSTAANGVVLVTTKKGEVGKTSLSYTNSTTFSAPLTMPEFQNTYGTASVGDFYSWGDKLSTPSTYSPKDFYQTGYSVNNSVNLSTGTQSNQTYVSLGNIMAEGIIRNNDFNRINFSFRNTTKFLKEKLTMDLQYSLSDINEKNMVAQGEYHNPIVPVYLFPPGDDFNKVKAFERYNAARNFPTQYWPYGDGLGLQNPYWVTDRELFENKKSRHMTTASLNYEFKKGINLSGRFKLDQGNEEYEKKFNASTNNLFASETGYYSLSSVKVRQMYGEALLNIDKYFLDNTLNLIANVGASIDDIKFDQNMYGGKLAMAPNIFTYSNVAQSTAEASQTGYRKQKQSVFASVQLGYKSLVYLDVTARNEWPSTLAFTNYSSFFYPSVGLSGIITDIFNIDTPVMPYMKLRVSYSEVGNEPLYHITNPTYPIARGGAPVTQTRMHNPYLRPERTKAWEAGVNFGFFRNKLKVDATVYKSSTYNQFFDVPLSAGTGFTSLYLNAGQIDNKGLELSVKYGEQFGKFSWNTYLTYSLNRNKIVELINENTKNPVTGDPVTLPKFDMVGTGNYRISLKEGGSMSDIYVSSIRTDEHGAVYVDPVTNTVVAESNKFIYAGSASPKYNLGWGNTFEWKGVSLGFLISARVGGVVVSNTQAFLDYYGVSKASAEARDAGGALVNGYRIPAKEYYQTIATPNGGAASMYVYSATNVRLGELTLGYDIPVNKWTNVIKGLNLSFIGRNLFFLYKKAPFDPEVTASTGTYFQGIDYFMQPSLRNLGFSVKARF